MRELSDRWTQRTAQRDAARRLVAEQHVRRAELHQLRAAEQRAERRAKGGGGRRGRAKRPALPERPRRRRRLRRGAPSVRGRRRRPAARPQRLLRGAVGLRRAREPALHVVPAVRARRLPAGPVVQRRAGQPGHDGRAQPDRPVLGRRVARAPRALLLLVLREPLPLRGPARGDGLLLPAVRERDGRGVRGRRVHEDVGGRRAPGARRAPPGAPRVPGARGRGLLRRGSLLRGALRPRHGRRGHRERD